MTTNLISKTIQRPFFQARDGILWIVLRGDIGEEKRSWFDNPKTLFNNAINSLPEKYRIIFNDLLRSGENKTKYGPNPKIPTIAVNLTQRTILRFNSINDTNRYFNICMSKKSFFKSPIGDYWIIFRGDNKKIDIFQRDEELIDAVMKNLTPDQKTALK